MAITQIGHADASGVSLATLAVTSHTVGNVLVYTGTSAITAANLAATAVTGGGVTTWTKIRSASGTAAEGNSEIWYGVVTSATASSLGITHPTTAVAQDLACEEFSFGSTTTSWSAIASASVSNATSSTSVIYPTITSQAGGSALYYGRMFTRSAAVAGSGAGPAGDAATYLATASPTDYCYILNCTASTSEKPVGKQTSATLSQGVAAVIQPKLNLTQALTPTPVATSVTDSEQVGKVLNDTTRPQSFNGTSDFATLALDLSPYSTLAVSLWLNWTTFSTDNDLLMEYSAFSDAPGQPTRNAFIIDPNANAGFGVGFCMGMTKGGDTRRWFDKLTAPSAGVSHHYIFMFDRVTPANTAWVDGTVQSMTTTEHDSSGTMSAFSNETTLYLMSRGGTSLFGAGSLSRVGFWGGVTLSAAEIAALATGANPSAVRTSGLLAEVYPDLGVHPLALDTEQVGWVRSLSVVTALTFLKSVAKAFTQTVGTACTDAEQTGKRLAASVGTAITKSTQVGKVFALTVGSAATRIVVAAKRISSSVTAVVTLTAAATIQFFATLSASVGTLATLLKQVGKILTPGGGGGYGDGGYGDDPYGEGAGAGATVLATLNAQIATGLTAVLNASVGTAAALTKQAGKLRSAAAGSAAAIARSAGKLLGSSAAATASQGPTSVGATRNPSVLIVPALSKSIAKTFSAAVSALVTLVEGAVRPLSFSISVGTAVTRRLSVGLLRVLSVGTSPTYLRDLAHACTTSAVAGIGVIKDVAKTISTSVTGLVTLDPHFVVHNFLTLTTHVTVVASWFRKAVLTPVICSVLTATAQVCDTLGLSAASDVLIAAAAQLDTTVTATAVTDGGVTATPVDDN